MSKYSQSLLIVLFFALDIFIIQGQESDQGLRNITGKFSRFCKSVPFEDIYLHSDKDVYMAGEYLWFSTYLFDRQSSSLSSGSSYAYIELLNSENQPVSQVRIRLENGTGSGGLILPDSLSNGDYTLRAYTNWMKNFLPDGCFMKTIKIYNLFSEKHVWTKDAVNPTDNAVSEIYFFPEGGRIMSGFKNKVGLRVCNKRGQEKGCKGFLTDQSSDTLITINVDSTGIGSFEFIPVTGKNYRLKADNGKSIFFLPVIYETGYALHVNNSEKNYLELTINADQISVSRNINWVYLIIQSNGKILFSIKEILIEKSTRIAVPSEILNPGINQIIVFDSGTNPVCERYVYKPFPDLQNINIKTADKFGRREKINLEIDLDTNLISPAGFSNYSLSVSALGATGRSFEISDYLILGNELKIGKGPIEKPINLWSSPLKSIDDFLLTIKSNWIDWGKIMSEKLPVVKYNFEKNGRFLSGIIKNQSNNETSKNKLIFLSVPGKIPVFKYAVVDSENRFSFFIRDNEHPKDMIIQPADFKNNYSLIIESPFFERYPEPAIFIDTTRISFTDDIIKWSINYQVNKIYGISSIDDSIKSDEILPKQIRFYGKPDQSLIMSDYINLPVMQEVFFELIPGVIIKTNKSKYGFYILDPLTRRIKDNMPALFVDGVIIDDPSAIINLDPELVEEIDIIKNEYIVGFVTFSGIINVITKAGDFSNVPLPRNAVRIRYRDRDYGFKFKYPDYSSDDKKNDRIPDFRNTLYWNPDLKPDKNGKILIDIATSDFISDYEINLQGAAGGKLFSNRKTIKVE